MTSPTSDTGPVPPVPARVAARLREVRDADAVGEWAACVTAALRRTRVSLELAGLTTWDRGRSSWVLRAELRGEPVVVKIPLTGARSHIAAQLHLAATGVGPTVRHHDDTLLVLPLLPATPLSELPDPRSALCAAAERLGSLGATGAPDGGGSLVEWLQRRLDIPPTDVSPTSRPPSAAELATAHRLLSELTTVQERGCHGDANPGNVLVESSGRIWLIDARGVAGDPCYDLATLSVKYCATRPADAEAVACELAGIAELPRDRTCMWIPVLRAARV